MLFSSRTGSKWFRYNGIDNIQKLWEGIKKMIRLYKQPNLRRILRTSIVILVTTETACILTAETIDLLFYSKPLETRNGN